MDEEWLCYPLSVPPPHSLSGTFSPIAEIVAVSGSGVRQPGSGFLIHPNVVVTAAHVVTFEGEAGATPAGWVEVRVGNASAWACSLTVRRGYFGAASSGFDIAMLLLPNAACEWADTCELLDEAIAPPTPIDCELCGFLQGLVLDVSVAVQSVGQFLEYTAQNLPGLSGGPLIVRRHDGRPVVAGLHRYHDHARGLGQALSLVLADITAPFAAMGLTLEPE